MWGLAWASPSRLGELALRLTPKLSPRRRDKQNHQTLHDFSLKRVHLVWARCFAAQSKTLFLSEGLKQNHTTLTSTRLGEICSPGRNARAQLVSHSWYSRLGEHCSLERKYQTFSLLCAQRPKISCLKLLQIIPSTSPQSTSIINVI